MVDKMKNHTIGKVIANVTEKELDILESSNIDWCPNINWYSNRVDALIFNEKDYHKALRMIGRK